VNNWAGLSPLFAILINSIARHGSSADRLALQRIEMETE